MYLKVCERVKRGEKRLVVKVMMMDEIYDYYSGVALTSVKVSSVRIEREIFFLFFGLLGRCLLSKVR